MATGAGRALAATAVFAAGGVSGGGSGAAVFTGDAATGDGATGNGASTGFGGSAMTTGWDATIGGCGCGRAEGGAIARVAGSGSAW